MNYIEPRIKKFIEARKELINTNNFYELYNLAADELYFSQSTGTLTRVLLSVGIDPLQYMNEIPYCYLYGKSTVTHFEIPSNIELIGGSAFSMCEELISVDFGSNVVRVGDSAFSECSNLTSVTLNTGLERIARYAFKSTNIAKIYIPETVTQIDPSAFDKSTILIVKEKSYAYKYATEYAYRFEVV